MVVRYMFNATCYMIMVIHKNCREKVDSFFLCDMLICIDKITVYGHKST